MYKNKSSTGFNNICGQKIKELRLQLPEKNLSAQICRYASNTWA